MAWLYTAVADLWAQPAAIGCTQGALTLTLNLNLTLNLTLILTLIPTLTLTLN